MNAVHSHIAEMMNCDCLYNNKRKQKNKDKEGYGLVDYIVNKLPEIHIPGYQYCGPGTDLQKRLTRGDPGVNKLDQACKDHDIVYEKVENSEGRREADKTLVARAFPRVYSQDAQLGERAAALLTTGLMGAKIGLSKIGLGLCNSKTRRSKKMKVRRPKAVKKKRSSKQGAKRQKKRNRPKKSLRKSIPFGGLVRGVKASIKKFKLKSLSLGDTIKAAIRCAKDLKRNKTAKISRVLKLPKFGGSVLPFIPILGALSAVGSIPASAVAIIKAIKKIIRATQNTSGGETKIGKGLYLMRSAKGAGFYLKPFKPRA